MKQFTFLQEGSNRILSKSKILLVLYSCEQLSIIYIIYQSTYFIEYFMQGNFKYPRIKKIHQVLEKITRFDQKVKILCVLQSHELLSSKTHYTSIYIFYRSILFKSKQVQKFKNYKNPTTTSRDINKTSLNFWKNIISISISFEFQV